MAVLIQISAEKQEAACKATVHKRRPQ